MKKVYCNLKFIKMQAKILFDITHLRFIGEGIGNINDGLFKVTNIDRYRFDFYTEKFSKEYGIADTKYIPGSAFAFSEFDIPDSDGVLFDEIKIKFEEAMAERLQYVESFLVGLWFIKDNSIGLWSTSGIIPSKNIVSRLSKSMSAYNCKGEKENCIFTPNEIEQVGKLTIKFYQANKRPLKKMNEMLVPSAELDNTGVPFRTFLLRTQNDFGYNDLNSVERAFHFLATARSQNILIYKIAYYMAVFESLFTTEQSEITMRMSYRVAFYIGENLEECREIFKLIYESYNIRSRFLHGQKFSSDSDIEITKLSDKSEKLDGILRRIFIKIINQDLEVFTQYEKSDRDGYLNSLVFGLPFERSNVKKEKKK